MIDNSYACATPDSLSHYFKDYHASSYMHGIFGFQLEDRQGRQVTPLIDGDGLRLVTKAGEVLRERKAFIRPESLHLLQPRHGDVLLQNGSAFVWGPSNGQNVSSAIVIYREGNPFFWPHSEVRCLTEREEWRQVAGYEGVYEVSNLGDVRRIGKAKGAIPGTILKPWTRRDGYFAVLLRNDGDDRHLPIHMLVAEAFLGPRPEGYHINHICGSRTNNRASNLEYVTALDNYIHAAANGNWHYKLTPDDVRVIRNRFATGQKIAHIARDFNISGAYCSKIVHRLHWPEIH